MNLKYPLFCLLCFIFFSCNNEDPTPEFEYWLIPASEVLIGAQRDAIPSVDDPKFASIENTSYLGDADLIVGFKEGDIVRGYSHQILDWHEIVNDEFTNNSIAITYCPLTGTAIGWDREIEGSISTFGVSGFLYNTNLIPYDRKTNSNWSQIRLDCVNGELEGSQIKTHQLVEMPYGIWKEMFPNSEVITRQTGYSRQYGSYPYINNQGQDYRTNPWLLFDVQPFDDRLAVKERVLGVIINGVAKVYRFDSFEENTVNIVNDEFEGKSLVLIGSSERNYMVAFESMTDAGTPVELIPIQEEGEVIAEDSQGNRWNVFGEAIEGPNTGERLLNVESFMGYWMSWGAFYPGLEIYE